MSIPWRPVKVDACRPGVNEQTVAYAASETDLFEARLLSEESEGSTKELELEPGGHGIAFRLISLAALLSLLAGMFYLLESNVMRASDPDDLRLAAEGVRGQGTFTIGQAVQALSVRH
jgi:hypothetical protein